MKNLVCSFLMITLFQTLMLSQSENLVKVEILSDWDGISDSFYLGVKFSISPGWYIYWRNPGDAGLAPEIHLDVPSYLKTGEIEFPLPEKIVHGDIVSYGYYKEVVLLIPVQVSSKEKLMKQGIIQAKVNWLVCSESCIPGSATLKYRISKASQRERSIIEQYRKRIPGKFESSGLKVEDFKVEKKGNLIFARIKFSGKDANRIVDFYPDENDKFSIDFKSIRVKDGVVEISARAVNPSEELNFLSGVVVLKNEGYELKLNLTKTK